ncbi:uncharacterized protein LOC126907944 isoform X5 [Daktulosphaira vitifoliae]|uniref:uncharacterized protein LOC126907944 isoform X5 n=1 Tax=Daktulosphaira vitifoliae TaxID=58002 RepID=UPI0021AA681A|nr:uncharacterized protein LOC126907944 isoform X5 [Daktulosphaira vitifoliae]
MKFFSFILIFIVIFLLQPEKGVHCENYHDMYENYIERVVSHIYLKIILYQNQDSKNATGREEDLQTNTIMLNLRQKYCYTIGILNFKYIEILQKYFDIIKLMLNMCLKYHKNNELNYFSSCVETLEKVLKISKTMFKKLHNAMKFISYLDIRLLFTEGFIPHPIIDVIDFIYQYVLEKSQDTSSLDLNKSPYEISVIKLENLTKFQFDASKRIGKFVENNKFMFIYILTDMSKIKIAELPNDLNFVRIEIINKFFNEIIEVWYKNLGFEEFIKPKSAEFIPPIDPDTNQNDGIEALNIIRRESGWKEMNHISIVYFGKQFSVDRIINDEVSNINFQIKKKHVSQLLRCRFTEIMKNYRSLFSAMLYICDKDAHNYYNNCVIKLFGSLVKSKTMLEDLYEALVTLKKSSIWSVNYTSESNLQIVFEWVAGFLSLLENNDFSLKNINDNKMIKQLLIIFKKKFNVFSTLLLNEIKIFDTLCHKDDKFKNVQYYVNYFRNPENESINLNPENSMQIMLNACNFFDNFCENVSKSCYKDLGFEKLPHCKIKN